MIKCLGALLILIGCGGFGFSLATASRKEKKLLYQMIHILNFMESELQFRLTPLPELCAMAARETSGTLRKVFLALSREISEQEQSEIVGCMSAAVRNIAIPRSVDRHLRQLGRCLGRFDLQGQLRGLSAVKNACTRDLSERGREEELRIRSYQTLGLCAGASLVILFV